MTRSAEKLAGDWEERIIARNSPIAWSKFVRRVAMIVAIIILSVSALYGFG